MYKLHPDCVKFINNHIDMAQPLNDFDYRYIAGSIIQATPRYELPSIHDCERDDKLMDMLAGYMKSSDPADGQDILDYLVNSIVKHYTPTIDGLIDDKIANTATAKKAALDEYKYQQYRHNKERI